MGEARIMLGDEAWSSAGMTAAPGGRPVPRHYVGLEWLLRRGRC